ncbi:hypothetical protein BOX15_Mlig032079g2 [Macrostomum lignano]|uniref:Uncharacterized protein n=1 Tax=Macrostomum lignano TaxID=282301 RepID=A0A267DVV5_9PLAT|nr:hypothetical protein BOX15_Mlig032079g2 [Macrostomum lignano]
MVKKRVHLWRHWKLHVPACCLEASNVETKVSCQTLAKASFAHSIEVMKCSCVELQVCRQHAPQLTRLQEELLACWALQATSVVLLPADACFIGPLVGQLPPQLSLRASSSRFTMPSIMCNSGGGTKSSSSAESLPGSSGGWTQLAKFFWLEAGVHQLPETHLQGVELSRASAFVLALPMAACPHSAGRDAMKSGSGSR